LKPDISILDAFYTVGLGGVCTGIGYEFGWTWAVIVGGAVLLVTVMFALLRRGD